MYLSICKCTLVVGLLIGSNPFAQACDSEQLEQQAFHNDIEAQYRLGQCLTQSGGPAAFVWLFSAAQQRHGAAQMALAWIYENGVNVQHDRDLALYWLEQAAVSGQTDAESDLNLLQRREQDETSRVHGFRVYTILMQSLQSKRQSRYISSNE